VLNSRLPAYMTLLARIEVSSCFGNPPIDLSIHTRVRASEQFSLRWPQIDSDRCILTLPRTKNGNPRHVPLNAVAMEALQTLKQQHEELNPDSPWVFLN
jgi:integrase